MAKKIEWTPEKKLETFRRIVANGQYEKVDGQRVDLFSASVICQVHDGLSEVNRAKLLSLPVIKIATLCFKLIK